MSRLMPRVVVAVCFLTLAAMGPVTADAHRHAATKLVDRAVIAAMFLAGLTIETRLTVRRQGSGKRVEARGGVLWNRRFGMERL